MPLLTIVLNVDVDASCTDPHDVAELLDIDTTGEIFTIWLNAGPNDPRTEVNMVSAEWT